jgi:hypothetical protein
MDGVRLPVEGCDGGEGSLRTPVVLLTVAVGLLGGGALASTTATDGLMLQIAIDQK